MYQFANFLHARTDFALYQNFRCGQLIIADAERLWPRQPPMVAAGYAEVCVDQPRYFHTGSVFQTITEEFLPWLEEANVRLGDAAILAPWWTKLYPLGRDLRAYGLQIVGPGARPYRRNRLIAPLSEAICGYLEESRPRLIPQIERELFFLLSDITGHRHNQVFSYTGRRTVYRLIRAAIESREQFEGAVAWLQSIGGRFSAILAHDGFIAESLCPKFSESVEDMCRDMRRNNVDIANLSVADLALFASPHDSLKLMTMHSSKGREFDAVALIDLHEGRIPDFRRSDTIEGVDEGRRLLYVAATRARRLLLYVTDTENWRNSPSRFLGPDYLHRMII